MGVHNGRAFGKEDPQLPVLRGRVKFWKPNGMGGIESDQAPGDVYIGLPFRSLGARTYPADWGILGTPMVPAGISPQLVRIGENVAWPTRSPPGSQQCGLDS